MNRRGKRIAFTVAATGLAVVLVVGILYRHAIRDHLQAWHFQLTRETTTIEPEPEMHGVGEVLEPTEPLRTDWCLSGLVVWTRHWKL